MNNGTQTPSDYLFAPSTGETRRLKRQADFLRRYTQYPLDVAGIRSGMKVLDVGKGIGDIVFLIAERVGPQGTVVGVDMYHGYCGTSMQHRPSVPARLRGDSNARA